jgi:hypothetical protein
MNTPSFQEDHISQVPALQMEALKEQKRGLMQKLLTGEIRVKVGDGRQKSEGRGQRGEPRNGTKGAK